MRSRVFLLSAFLIALTGASAWAQEPRADARRGPSLGTVYTASNAAAGNAVLLFDQLPDGLVLTGLR